MTSLNYEKLNKESRMKKWAINHPPIRRKNGTNKDREFTARNGMPQKGHLIKKHNIYAWIANGELGLVNNWPACKAKVHGISRAHYKGFFTRSEAIEWIKYTAERYNLGFVWNKINNI